MFSAKSGESGREDIPVGDRLSYGAGFEFFLHEWGTAPDYILNNWSDELFALMIGKLNARYEKQPANDGKSSDAALFHEMGSAVTWHKQSAT